VQEIFYRIFDELHQQTNFLAKRREPKLVNYSTDIKVIAVARYVNVETENLPYPYVENPRSWSGAFPGFRKAIGEPVHFCECQRSAIRNYLTFISLGIFGFEGFGTQNFPRYLGPNEVQDAKSIEAFLSSLKFHPELCHQCNKRCPPPPPARWNQPSEPFATLFRYYIAKVGFENGVSVHHEALLPGACSSWVHDLIPQETLDRLVPTNDDATPRRERKALRKLWTIEFHKVVEHVRFLTRRSFGFPAKGHSRISETILFLRTRSAFSETKVIPQYRRRELGGMSLDIYIPALSVAIEYQGDQHFNAVGHWGGEAALKLTQDRDLRKKQLCDQLGISLLYFDGDATYVSEREIRRQVEKATVARLLMKYIP
jgi:hypothetical protein